MAQTNTDQRRTKKDLKRKRVARGYKRGGQFRTMNVSEAGGAEEPVTAVKKTSSNKNKNKKY